MKRKHVLKGRVDRSKVCRRSHLYVSKVEMGGKCISADIETASSEDKLQDIKAVTFYKSETLVFGLCVPRARKNSKFKSEGVCLKKQIGAEYFSAV